MHESSQFTTADALHPEAIYIEYFELFKMSLSKWSYPEVAEPINFIGEFDSNFELIFVVDLTNNASAFKQSSFSRLWSSKYLIINWS